MKWVELSHRAKFKLSGPDRVRYLNGQVTNQVDQNLSGKSIPACVCNLKGKIEALIFITALGDDLLIDADAGQREAVFARLDRYLIADDCELVDVTDEFSLRHVFEGDGSARFGIPGRDVWDEKFSPKSDAIGEAEVERLRIENRIPKWGHELTGDEFPAEVGLDKTAVDFHKGCYLGQEIVSRIESVGKVKRHLAVLTSPGNEKFPLAAGHEWTDDNGKTKGKITSVAPAFSGRDSLALALINGPLPDGPDESNFPDGITPWRGPAANPST